MPLPNVPERQGVGAQLRLKDVSNDINKDGHINRLGWTAFKHTLHFINSNKTRVFVNFIENRIFSFSTSYSQVDQNNAFTNDSCWSMAEARLPGIARLVQIQISSDRGKM